MSPKGRSEWWLPAPKAATDRYRDLAETTRLRMGLQSPLRADPRERKDGCCVNCRGSRPEVAIKSADPFCSTRCARTWHDQLTESPSTGG
jgi:hypothetical protein